MPAKSIEELYQISSDIRQSVIKMLEHAGSGHSAGSLGMADVFTALYFYILKHDPHKSNWLNRDRVILSNGHICPVWYATLAQAGYFDKKELFTFRQINSRLQGHPHYHSIPGVENTSGSLGQGLSQAIGVALALKMEGKPNQVYALLSDGEHQEGQTWESYLFASAQNLTNLTVLIDRNNIQIGGMTEDVMPLEKLKEKIESFNWHVIEIDGHNFEQIISACHQAQSDQVRPTAIICHTIPGKGVDFMEGRFDWHGKSPDKEQAKIALKQIRTLNHKIICHQDC